MIKLIEAETRLVVARVWEGKTRGLVREYNVAVSQDK